MILFMSEELNKEVEELQDLVVKEGGKYLPKRQVLRSLLEEGLRWFYENGLQVGNPGEDKVEEMLKAGKVVKVAVVFERDVMDAMWSAKGSIEGDVGYSITVHLAINWLCMLGVASMGEFFAEVLKRKREIFGKFGIEEGESVI